MKPLPEMNFKGLSPWGSSMLNILHIASLHYDDTYSKHLFITMLPSILLACDSDRPYTFCVFSTVCLWDSKKSSHYETFMTDNFYLLNK